MSEEQQQYFSGQNHGNPIFKKLKQTLGQDTLNKQPQAILNLSLNG